MYSEDLLINNNVHEPSYTDEYNSSNGTKKKANYDTLENDAEVNHEREGYRICDPLTLWSYTGPGWLMSIAYLDPGNIVSDLQAGAYTGYQLLWVLFWATFAGWLCQVLALSIGAVTGKHLAEVCRERYPRYISILIWLMAEGAIVGNDIQQIIGSAVAFRILFGFPLWVGSLITAVDTFTFLFIQYFGVRKLEAFFATLVGTISICFFINFGFMAPPAGPIFENILIPNVKDYAVLQLVGLVGAVIMPHNVFLHSASVASRKIDRSDPKKVTEAIKYLSIDAGIALLVSFLVNGAVISVFAHGFFAEECAVQNMAMVDGECAEIGLFNAGQVLQNFLKGHAETVWAIGLLAAGQAATMTGTFAGQYVMEGFLNLRVSKWVRVLITRLTALVPALIVSLYAAENEGAEDIIDEWLNVLQSIQLPFAILPALHFASSIGLMGEFSASWLKRGLMWLLSTIVVGTNYYLIYQFFRDSEDEYVGTWYFYIIVVVLGLLYFAFICYLIVDEAKAAFKVICRNLCCCSSRLTAYGNEACPDYEPIRSVNQDGGDAPASDDPSHVTVYYSY